MATAPESVFVVRAEGQRLVVRAPTRAPVCPEIEWDAMPAQSKSVRAAPASVMARRDGEQTDSTAAVFNILTCEAVWPVAVARARVAGVEVPSPTAEIKRIVVIADTGCRMKASENFFQSCSDPQQWPFAQVAQSAARLKPDLVVHIG